MATFIVRTWERAEGSYAVKAESREEALAHFDDGPPIDWTGVEQIELTVFEVEADEAVSAESRDATPTNQTGPQQGESPT